MPASSACNSTHMQSFDGTLKLLGGWMTRRLIPAALLLVGACSTPFTVVEHPLPQEQAASTATASEAGNVYWSAYAFLDPTHLPQLWQANPRTDYLLVMAHAQLPTYGQPMVRDFPLYTIDHGSVSTHAGVDLLYKYPVATDARDQIAVTIEIKYLKNQRALDITRTILRQTEAAAKPFAGNFEVASQMLSGATGLIDALVEQAQSPNSFRFSFHPDDFAAGPMTKVFVLHANARGRGQESQQLDLQTVVACADKPGALCRQTGSTRPPMYTRDHVREFAYLTLRLEPTTELYDPLLLVHAGSLTCGSLNVRAIDAARNHLQTYRPLYKPEDVTAALAAYDLAQSIVDARELAHKRRFGELLDLLNVYGRGELQHPHASASLQAHIDDLHTCYRKLWSEASPGREILAAYTLYTEGNSPAQQTSEPHRDDRKRLNHIAYFLGAVAELKGVLYDPADPRSWAGEGGALLALLRSEALVLSKRQQDLTASRINARGKELCTSAELATLLRERVSTFCAPCLLQVQKFCGPKANIDEVVEEVHTGACKVMREELNELSKWPAGKK